MREDAGGGGVGLDAGDLVRIQGLLHGLARGGGVLRDGDAAQRVLRISQFLTAIAKEGRKDVMIETQWLIQQQQQ